MSILPDMVYKSRITKSNQVKFGGLNHSYAAKDGDLWDMKNLSSDHSPVLGTRPKRYLVRKLEQPGGLYNWEKLCWVDGNRFFYDEKDCGEVAIGQKHFATLGSKIVIFPDKCYYDVDLQEFGKMESTWKGQELTFENGLYHGESAEANTIRADGVDWSQYFRVGDGVTISGCEAHPGNNKTDIIRDIDGDKLYFYENAFTLDGDLGTDAYSETGTLSICRSVPDMDYLWENENRLWGCKGDYVYSCKLGDIFNWNNMDDLADASWSVDTGSPGDFTGCIAFRGYITMFKEGNIYKIYGTLPSNFQLLSSSSMGVAKGSGRSLAVAGETLFYLSRNGIVAYSGGVPQAVGDAFGTERFQNAVAGSDGLKYYVSMQGEDGKYRLYVYDTQRYRWHIEDESHITHFANQDGILYMLNEQGEIWTSGHVQTPPAGASPETKVPFEVEFADFTDDDPNKKGISKLQLRIELEDGASAQVWIQFDSDGQWHKFGDEMYEDVKRSFYLPIIPRRCDHYRIKITGEGDCRIYSMVRESYSGSELRSKSRRN